MIIRKPFAFLIKHFRIIHLLLLVPTLYLAFKFGDIAKFFKLYVNAGYKTLETTFAGNYITILTFICLFILIIANAIIFVLMKAKKKNGLFYMINILYYLFLAIFSIILFNTMSSMETTQIETTTVDLIKDMSGICVIPIYVLLAITFIKGIGFNIKTFRFEKNGDLQITDEDYEEIEIKIGGDNYTAKKNIVHTFRELKYYFLENKFIFTCLGVIFLLIVGISLYMNYQVYNKHFNINQAFALDNFTMTLKESYITNVDYTGQTISNDNYYLVIKMTIYNKSNEDLPIEKSNFRVYFGNKYIFPNYDRSSRFIDIGKPYQGQTIYKNTTDDYVLAYELDKSMVRNEYQMKILSDLKHEPGKLIPSYKIINIKPADITKVEDIGEAKINSEVKLNNTILKDTTYQLKEFKLVDRYEYTYQSCITVDECYNYKQTLLPTTGKVLAIIKDNIDWDMSTSYYKNGSQDLYNDFANLSYRYVSGQTVKRYNDKMRNVTPANLKGYKVYEVPMMAMNSNTSDMSIKFVFRNKILTVHT